MSYDRSCCVGTFLKVYLNNIEVEQEAWGCSSCKTEVKSSLRFCSTCGQRLADYISKETKTLNIYNWLDDNFKVDTYVIRGDVNNIAYISDNHRNDYCINVPNEGIGSIPTPAPDTYLKELKDKLTRDGIKWEVIYGVFSYYW